MESNRTGYWTTMPQRPLSTTTFGHLSDDELAGKIRMLMRNDLMHEAVVTAARDRLVWLAQRNKQLENELAALRQPYNIHYKGRRLVEYGEMVDRIKNHIALSITNDDKRNDDDRWWFQTSAFKHHFEERVIGGLLQDLPKQELNVGTDRFGEVTLRLFVRGYSLDTKEPVDLTYEVLHPIIARIQGLLDVVTTNMDDRDGDGVDKTRATLTFTYRPEKR